MVNILIADDNLYYAKVLMNIINNSINNVKVVNIATDGKETIEELNNYNNIDVILLDLKMPVISGLDIMRKFDENKRKKFKNSIIVISGEADMIAKIRDEDMVYSCINKSCSMSDIIEKVKEIVNYKEKKKNTKQLRKIIYKELQDIGYNLSHKGTIYLIDAIILVYNKKLKDELNLKRDIYPILSKKYNKPVQSIKNNMIKATDYMDSTCTIEKKKKYFSFNDNSKITVKLVIFTILNNIYSLINQLDY